MKKQLNKKVPAFITVFSVVNLFFFSSCQKEINTPTKTNDLLKASVSSSSSIVYTDVVPDLNVSGATYNLDLNNDEIYDFTFSSGGGRVRCGTGLVSLSSAKVSPIGSLNAIMDSGKYPGALDTNTVIGKAGAKWSSATLQILRFLNQCSVSGPLGNWNIGEEKYLGLKIKNGQNTYYGWVRIVVFVSSISNTITIKDYAYNSIANQPILAGQTK